MRLTATHVLPKLTGFLCLILGMCSAHELLAQGTEKVTATADNLVAGERNGQSVEQLIGHVQFAQGSLYGSADSAIHYTSVDRLDLLGHVEIHQDTLSLYAPIVIYHGDTRTGHAEGGVKMTDRDALLTAQDGDYDMERQVATFHHHVTIFQDRSIAHSDDLIYYRSTQTTILTGNVDVRSDSGKLTANKATYIKALGEMTAEGNVHITNDSLRLSGDWVYDSKSLGESFARGHVIVEDPRNNTIIYGDTLARFVKNKYSIVPRNPLLLSIDSSLAKDNLTGNPVTRFDTMFVKSRVMEVYQGDSVRFIATDSVRILRSDFSAVGGTMDYNEARNLLTIGNALRQHLWYDSTEIDADSVALFTRNRHVNRVFAIGHAFATDPLTEMPGSDRVNQLAGEKMMLVVENDSAKLLLDMSNALSIYFKVDNGKASGVNRASGDTIRIDFKRKTASRVTVISGTEGEYFPERFVKGRAKAFRLSSFERHDSLRPKRSEFGVPWEMSGAVPAGAVISPIPASSKLKP